MSIMDGFLIKIFRSFAATEEEPGRMTIVVKRPYAYLEKSLQSVFEGQDDTEVIIDRRNGNRQASGNPGRHERRRDDRRGEKETILEVAITSQPNGLGQ